MGAGDTDGIDSNGNIIITGGTVYVNGQQVTTLPNQFMGGGMGGFGGGPGGMGGGPGGGRR